jgi:hypothetical protein
VNEAIENARELIDASKSDLEQVAHFNQTFIDEITELMRNNS